MSADLLAELDAVLNGTASGEVTTLVGVPPRLLTRIRDALTERDALERIRGRVEAHARDHKGMSKALLRMTLETIHNEVSAPKGEVRAEME